MALFHAIGFETNSLSNGVEVDSLTVTNGGGLSIVTTPVQTGGRSLKCNAAAPSTGDGFHFQNSSSHSQYIKLSLQISAYPTGSDNSFIVLADSTNGIAIAYMSINTNGALSLVYSDSGGGFTQIGSQSAVLSLNTWYIVELHVDDTAGIGSTLIEGRLNKAVFATATESVFASGNGGVPNGFTNIGDQLIANNQTGTWFIDDIVCTDSSGASMTGYPGDARVARVTPNAAGDVNTYATQTGGTAGSANNFTRIDEITPDNATTFNGSSTLNQEDLFKNNDPALSGNTINAVMVMGVYRNSTADATGAAKLEIEKAAAGTILQGSAIVPNSTTWKTTTPTLSIIAYTDPDGAAWTETTLATMEIGYKLTTAPGTAGRRVDFSTVWAYVVYTPSAGGATPATLPMMGVGS